MILYLEIKGLYEVHECHRSDHPAHHMIHSFCHDIVSVDGGDKVQTRGACVRNVLSGVLAGVLEGLLEGVLEGVLSK